MSNEVKNAIDAGLQGLCVSDRDVAAILRRVRTEERIERSGSSRWGFAAAIAAVMVALVLGAGAKLLGGTRDVTPLDQPDGQVTYVPGAETTFQPVSIVTAVPEINIGANEAIVIAESHIHQTYDGMVDLRDATLYAISCAYLDQAQAADVSLANVYEVSFSALDEYGTAYTVHVNADDGSIVHCELQRGVGVGHTAEEIRTGYGRIWGTDMARWTWKQLASYRSALKSADLDSMHWTDIMMRDNTFPDPDGAFITADEAAQIALAVLKEQGVTGSVEATVYLRAGAKRVWRVTVAQDVGSDGMEWVHFVEVDESRSVSSHSRVDRANAQLLSFIADYTFQSNMQVQENSSIPNPSDEVVRQAAADHIRVRYGETQDVNDPSLYICKDANGVTYAAIDRYLVYEPVDPAGMTYWVCVDWYGGIVDSGAGVSADGVVDIDLLRMQAVDGVPYRPHENEPDFYMANEAPFASGYYYTELFSLQALLRESGDLADPVAQLFLNTEYVMGEFNESINAVHKALGVKHCNTESIHIRKDGDVIERLSIVSEKGDFLVEYSTGKQAITSVVQVKDCYDPWYAPFLLQSDMEQAGIAPEPYVLPEIDTGGKALTAEEAGVLRGMRISHLNDRYRALYGLNLANWSQEQLRSWQQMAIITESVGDDLGVFCLRNTYYPDVPAGAISRETAAEIGAQAIGLKAGYRMDGAVLIGTDGDPVWKVCLYGGQEVYFDQGEGYWYAEVNCMTGEVTAIRKRLEHGAWEMPYYGADSVEYWFRDVVLEKTIEECELVWDCKSNG